MEFDSTDPSFSVSWLLGLQPYQHKPAAPAWAKQYESNDPNFSVSWLLGLVPRQKSRRARKKRRTRTAFRKRPARPEEEDEGIDPLGLRRLYGDLSEEEEKKAESDKKAAEADSEVLVEAAFLELCQELENLLDDIEYVNQQYAPVSPTYAN